MTLKAVSVESWVRFGRPVASISDVNQDSIPDLVVNTSIDDRVHLFGGADGRLLRSIPSPNAGEQLSSWFGEDVAGIGDVDGDGAGDLLVGAHHETANGHQRAGHAYLFDGGSGALLQTLRSPSPQPSGSFGGSVAASDVDEDGVPDLIIGAWGEERGNQEDTGQVYIFTRSP